MKEMREALKTEELQKEWTDSVHTPIDLLNQQMRRLQLKESNFKTFTPATEDDLEGLWDICLNLDSNIDVSILLGQCYKIEVCTLLHVKYQ